MDEKSLQEEFAKRADNAEQLAEVAAGGTALLPGVLRAVSSSEAAVRFKSIKVLKLVSETNPETLYPHFGFFAELLDGGNSILRWNAIDILANLAAADGGNRFGSLFRKVYGLLDEGGLITAAHIVDGSARIVAARPGLEQRVTKELLRVEEIALPTEECRNILRGKVVTAFGQYIGQSRHSGPMLSFAEGLLTCTRPATRKKAEEFLKRHRGR